MTDPLDWQILDAKAPEEPEPPLTSPPDQPVSGRRWWWIGGLIGGAALVALVAPYLLSSSRETQLHTTVSAVVASEPRISPIAYAITTLGPLQVDAITDVGDGRVRASLSYTATDVDGLTLRFTLDRSLKPEGTLLASDPAAVDETVITLHGSPQTPRVDLDILAGDSEFIIRDVAPYLEDVARRACGVWSCPEGTTARLSLTQTSPGAGEQAIEPLDGSWLLASGAETPAQTSVSLPAPILAGQPADPASLDSYRRRLAMRLLSTLARQLVDLAGQPGASTNSALVADALAARTAALLNLEAASVGTAHPDAEDAGLISDSPAGPRVVAERALLRLNAFLGEPGSPLERELWSRLQRAPTDVIGAAVELAHETRLPPEAVMDLVWGGGLTHAVVRQLTRPDWLAQLACVDGVHVVGAGGHGAVKWDTLAASRVLEVGPLSADGTYQALVFAGQPLLLDIASGHVWWMVWPDPVPGRSPRFAWGESSGMGIVDTMGAWVAQIKFDPTYASLFRTPVANSASYRWEGGVYRVSLPDATGGDSRVFRAQQVTDSKGNVVADWGLAAWPSLNPRTGEIAVLSRVEDPTASLEYRITIYANPTDPTGRVVWRSSDFGWTADQTLAWAAIQWIGDDHDVVGIVRPASDGYYTPLPVVWRTDPDTAQSVELPTLKLASSTIFDFSVSADGEYVALVSAAAQGPGTRASVVSTLDGELVNAFDLPGGLLTWAPSGHVFAFEGGGRPEVYAQPEDHAPIWSLSDTGCANLVWRPAHTLSNASSLAP